MGNPFASQSAETIPMAGDDGQTVTVRKLTGREAQAAQAAQAAEIAEGRVNGFGKILRLFLQKGTPATTDEAARVLADPMLGVNRYAVIRFGLISWSYPQPIPAPVDVTQHALDVALDASKKDAIDDLDDERVDFLATAIWRKTKPGLFLTTEEAQAARKND